MMAAAFSTLLFSCDDDDKKDDPTPTTETPEVTADAPEITVTATSDADGTLASGAEVTEGDVITFSLAITAPGVISKIYAEDDEYNADNSDLTDTSTSATLSVSVETTEAMVGSTFDLEFIVVDALDQSDTARFSFSVIELDETLAQTPRSLSQFTLASATSDETSYTFYSTANHYYYSKAEVESSSLYDVIDFAYYLDDDKNHVITCPAEFPTDEYDLTTAGWTTLNTTTFITTDMTTNEYNALTTVGAVRDAIDGLDFTSASTSLSNPNGITAFKTASGIQGFLWMLSNSSSGSKGKIMFKGIIDQPK